MIARVWRGATLADDGDAYAAYLEQTGMRMLFDAMEDVRGFAGELEVRHEDVDVHMT